MAKLFICGKWPLEIYGETIEDAIEVGGSREVRHEKRLQHLSHNAWAFYLLLQRVEGVETVLDYCAGIGLWATIARCELKPRRLVLNDLDLACVQQLQRVFRYPGVAVRHGSYDDVLQKQFDLVCMDITIHTAMRSLGKDPDVPLLKVLETDPKYVIISDCAGGKLHLNRESYENLLGTKGPISNYDEYLEAFSRRIHEKTGYCTTAVVKCGNVKRPHSCYLLLKRNGGRITPMCSYEDIPMKGFRPSSIETPFKLGCSR